MNIRIREDVEVEVHEDEEQPTLETFKKDEDYDVTELSTDNVGQTTFQLPGGSVVTLNKEDYDEV